MPGPMNFACNQIVVHTPCFSVPYELQNGNSSVVAKRKMRMAKYFI